MEPTGAKDCVILWENEQMNQNFCVCTEVWTHDTGVLLDSGKKVKRNQNDTAPLLFFLMELSHRSSLYLQDHLRWEEEGRRGFGVFFFLVRRGGSGYSLSLAFRILRMHICQLS